MKKAFVFLAQGFEVTEALATVDVLRRGKVETKTVSISDKKEVESSNGTLVKADMTFDKKVLQKGDMIVLPGGIPGTPNLEAFFPLIELIGDYNREGKWIAAICAAPTILGHLGLLRGKRAVCYPGMEEGLEGAVVANESVVRDGNIITAKGMGVSQLFGVRLLEVLTDRSFAEQVAAKAVITTAE